MRFSVLTFVVLLVGCDSQSASNTQRITALEGRVSALEKTVQEQQQAVGNWILWQVSEAFNAGYPLALSAYNSKSACSTAAAAWSFPGGTVVAQDPTIFQMKGYRIKLECLPAGTTPYAH